MLNRNNNINYYNINNKHFNKIKSFIIDIDINNKNTELLIIFQQLLIKI